jgi:hypothetical protein
MHPMILNISKIDTYRAIIDDKPGSLSGKLEGLAQAGADLEFVLARRISSQPGKGFVYVTPLTGDTQIAAAKRLGFEKSPTHHAVRVEGADSAGVAYLITRAIAAAKINLRGFTAATQGSRFVAYLAFDNAKDAEMAMARLNRAI